MLHQLKRIARRFLTATDAELSSSDRYLLETVKRDLLPPGFVGPGGWVPTRLTGTAGFDLDFAVQIELVRKWRTDRFGKLFKQLLADDEVCGGLDAERAALRLRGLIHNGYYPTPDAEIYAAMILEKRPKNIIEIGSGYSTVVARAAVRFAELDCKIHVYDPMPRRTIAAYADHVNLQAVEHSNLAAFPFDEDTLLFIDSSHVCRPGGDVPFLFCEVLPRLPPKVLVHVHDVYVPYDYPDRYVERFYDEQYVLHALLANSSKFKVVLATHAMARAHPDEMRATFGAEVAKDDSFYGASFWMEST